MHSAPPLHTSPSSFSRCLPLARSRPLPSGCLYPRGYTHTALRRLLDCTKKKRKACVYIAPVPATAWFARDTLTRRWFSTKHGSGWTTCLVIPLLSTSLNNGADLYRERFCLSI